jgi:ABC-type polysaccharide/polyol phosphate export permease
MCCEGDLRTMSLISTYSGYRELYWNLTLRELRSKYKRSFLGWTWSLLNPAVNTLVYTILFGVFLKVSLPPGKPSGIHYYAIHLLCGLLPWNFFSTALMSSIGSLVGNANLIKKTYFPRALIPAAAVGAALVSHLIEMSVLVIALVAFGNWRVIPYLPLILLLIATVSVFGLGVGLLLSVLNVYFRDIEHFMGILLLVWIYASPIVYPLADVPHGVVFFLKLNPWTDIVLCFQNIMYNGSAPGLLELTYGIVAAVVALIVGLTVFGRREGRLAEEL